MRGTSVRSLTAGHGALVSFDMEALEFDTHAREAPSALVWGFVKLERLHAIAAKVRCYGEGDSVAGISLFRQNSDGRVSQVYLRLYRLPAAEATLTQDLKLEADAINPAADNSLANALAPNVPPHWRHKTVMDQNGRRIVHAWRGKSRALLIRYVVDRGTIADDDLFPWAAKNLSIVDGAWLLDPPIV